MLTTTDITFNKDIESGVCLVDFWAEWCGPCRIMIPRLEELADRIGNKAKIMKMNVDENPQTAQNFRIMSIPTMIIFNNSKPVEFYTGIQDINELEKRIIEELKI